MILVDPTGRADPGFARSLDVEVVVPAFNEERDLAQNIGRLRDYLDRFVPFNALVTIADNASTDGTEGIARRLESELAGVRAIRLDEKGRGRALRTVWLQSEASVVCYMDVDLSTHLDAVLPLVAPLLSGHSDLAIGSRLAPGARVVRGPKREFISRSYNLLVRAVLGSSFSDAQCGFKAMSRDAAQALLPLVADNGWFFDTELLVLAERNGLRIHEVAVDWIDDRESTVQIASAVREDLRGIFRLLRVFTSGGGWTDFPGGRRHEGVSELARIAGIGLASSVTYVLLFAAFRAAWGPLAANGLALCTTTIANFGVHHWFTRGGKLRHRYRRDLVGTAAATSVSFVFTTLALVVADLLAVSAVGDVIALILATIAAAPLRLVAVKASIDATGTDDPGTRLVTLTDEKGKVS